MSICLLQLIYLQLRLLLFGLRVASPAHRAALQHEPEHLCKSVRNSVTNELV